MPELTLEGIRALIEERVWGTLMAIDGNKPYGVELAYTFMAGCPKNLFSRRMALHH